MLVSKNVNHASIFQSVCSQFKPMCFNSLVRLPGTSHRQKGMYPPGGSTQFASASHCASSAGSPQIFIHDYALQLPVSVWHSVCRPFVHLRVAHADRFFKKSNSQNPFYVSIPIFSCPFWRRWVLFGLTFDLNMGNQLQKRKELDSVMLRFVLKRCGMLSQV